MATFSVLRPLTFSARPISQTDRVRLHKLLDEWYELSDRFPDGGFTDLCEVFEVHPGDLRRAVMTYRRARYRRLHGHGMGYKPKPPAEPAEPTIWDDVQPPSRFW